MLDQVRLEHGSMLGFHPAVSWNLSGRSMGHGSISPVEVAALAGLTLSFGE